MTTSLRARYAPMPVVEPSTDFPTLEDESPCEHAFPTRLVTLIAGSALIMGLAAGFALGRILGG